MLRSDFNRIAQTAASAAAAGIESDALSLHHKVLDTARNLGHLRCMLPAKPRRNAPPNDAPPIALHARAESDLAFVRGVMERSHHFTAVPGVGGMFMGVTAIAAAMFAFMQPTRERWLMVWLIEAALAIAIATFALVNKAKRSSVPLSTTPARRFALGLFPALLAGGVLTVACLNVQAWTLLPPVWLACYGVAILGGGAVSAVPAVPILGGVFVAASVLAVATPAAWSDVWLGLAFGGGHLIVGAIVARRHGG